MADTTILYSNISGILNTAFEPQITTQLNRATVLARLLPKKPAIGKAVNWVARVDGTTNNTAGAVSDGASVTTHDYDVKVQASLQYCTYSDAISLGGRAIMAALNSGGPDALVDLLGEEVENAIERVAQAINTDLYTGSGGTSPETLAGLSGLAIDNSASYAGIARTGGGSYATWQSTVNANGGVSRALSLQLMRDVRRSIFVACGQKPDLIVCDPIQHEAYGNLLGANRRYVQEVQMNGQMIKLDGGYQALEFDGIPVIEDKDAPSGRMFFLNTRYINLRVLPDAMQRIAGGTNGMAEIQGNEEEQLGGGPLGLSARIQPLAINGDARPFQLLTYLQLQVQRPNACGVLKDLS